MLNPTDYEKYLDQEYLEFVGGKRVAIVGPAAYLSTLGLGGRINFYDLVVRVNRGLELIPEYGDHIGHRTDLIYNCLIESPDNGGAIDIDVLKEAGVKWVSTIPHSDFNGMASSNRLHDLVNASTLEEIKKNFRFHIMDHHLYTHLNKQVKSRANTGFSAIVDLLQHNVQELFIAGFSFYLDDFMGGYKKGCERNERVFASQCFVSKRHNQKEQWKFMKNLVVECDRVKTDPVLSYILSMKDLSREEFRSQNEHLCYSQEED